MRVWPVRLHHSDKLTLFCNGVRNLVHENFRPHPFSRYKNTPLVLINYLVYQLYAHTHYLAQMQPLTNDLIPNPNG